ncbi:serine/arginine-rich splicing factor SR45a isoform X2 [Salvia hispanica]|uniref:serine/arginine-rich splicing factor SR45a isoform X2 n=1 Tax=Salvia hispanica TaxID=49212 RepID=UPI002009CC3A|nr:serine/arginine-rich splicing factor SR45a isoform X2 [Salvia hispanica]
MSYSRRSRSPSPYNKRYSRSFSRSPIPSRSRSRSYDSSDAENPGNNLYVTGLSARVTKRDLEKHFSTEGKVEDVHLVVDPRTRESRGFGFVTMSSLKEAERCIKYLDRSVLEGRVISVEKARRRRGRTPTPGRYLGLKTVHERRRSPSYSPYSRSRSPCYSSEGDRSRSRSYSPCYRRRRRSYSPYYRRRRRSYSVGRSNSPSYYRPRRSSYSRSRSPSYSRSPVSRRDRSYSPYHRDYSPDSPYYRRRYRDYSPEDRYYRRSRYRSISPRYRRSSRRSYSLSLTPRSYSRSVSPTPTRDVSPSSMKCLKRSRSPRKRAPSRTSRSHSRSPSASLSSPTASRSVSPRR